MTLARSASQNIIQQIILKDVDRTCIEIGQMPGERQV